MKVLIAGLGSVGQRHARNLRALLGSKLELFAHRMVGRDQVIADDMSIVPGASVEETYGIRSFEDLDAALAERPDAVLVCNPTSLHAATAIAAMEAGCHVFIEKPLADAGEAIDRMIELATRKQLVAAVGYQMRCHPALLRARELALSGAIGRVRSVRAEFGEYLPDAHPYEDYRISYAARAALGGGVILCYIHEFDYLCWMFGMPVTVSTTGGRLGALDIDVEDTAVTNLQCCVNGHGVTIEVRQSFLQRPPVRTCRMIGNRGTIRVDLQRSTLHADGAVSEMSAYPIARNELFLQELRHFLSAVSGSAAPIVTLPEAAQSLKIAMAAKASLATGQPVTPA